MAVGPLVVHVARLRRPSGTAVRVHEKVRLDPDALAPATVADSGVPEGAEAEVDVLVEPYVGGLMVTGTVTSPWLGVCRRCTAAARGVLEVPVQERFCEPPGPDEPEDAEAYPIADDAIDLAPLVHEAVLGELPLAPLCREDCQGLCPWCGIDRNEERCACVAPRDPRWASLDVLRSTS
ncbi:MAG: YceD family protein [Acidimicrobiales bacterium]